MTRPMPGPPDCTCIGRGNGCLTCLDTIGYDLEATCPGCPVHAGPSYLEHKRLTDAECAAEYWRAASDFRDRLRHGLPGDDLNPEWGRRLTWHRFATHPHALEEA